MRRTELKTLFILGATGFIGRQTAQLAIRQGWRVLAIARDPKSAGELAEQGVCIIKGDASRPAEWIRYVTDADVLIDLVQPKFPERIGLAQVNRIAAERLALTAGLLEALDSIPLRSRPLLFSVSGLDDLATDSSAQISESSDLRAELRGFSRIGIPVRRLLEKHGIGCAFIYLATVYGPGKAFAGSVFPRMAAGKFRIPGAGNNHIPLVHVEDAARALVHLAGLPPSCLSGRSIVVVDRGAATLKQFFGHAAAIMNVPLPAVAPLWLARLISGTVLCEHMTRDVIAAADTLSETGFEFNYETYREGLPPTLDQLGYQHTAQPHKKPSRPGSSAGLLWMVALSLAAMIIVNVIDFPGSAAQVLKLSRGLPLLDMRFSYSDHELYRLFDVLGPIGRKVYLHFYWTSDLILPALFGRTLWLAIRGTPLRIFKWLAVAAAGFDYAENIAATILLLAYPERLSSLARGSSAFTSCKWTFYGAAVLASVTGILFEYRWKRTATRSSRFTETLSTHRRRCASANSTFTCLPGSALTNR